jgi:hypothetical protein
VDSFGKTSLGKNYRGSLPSSHVTEKGFEVVGVSIDLSSCAKGYNSDSGGGGGVRQAGSRRKICPPMRKEGGAEHGRTFFLSPKPQIRGPPYWIPIRFA